MDIQIIDDAELLARIEAFVIQHGMPPTTFGRLALNDGDLISDLKDGRSLRLKSVNKVITFMSSYKPLVNSDEGPAPQNLDDNANRINPKPQQKTYLQGHSQGQVKAADCASTTEAA